MAPDPHASRMDDEIAEIENRSGTRTLFLILGGVALLLLTAIVVIGARERSRLAEIADRPQTMTLELGRYLGTVGGTAVFAAGDHLTYVEGIAEEIEADGAVFARQIEYDESGLPVPVPASVNYWSLTDSDSLPYIVEPVLNPLTGVSPSDYRALPLVSLQPSDYGSGAPNDWRTLEFGGTNVSVTGEGRRVEGAVYLVADSARVRLQGIQGLSGLDSLEVAWATENQAPLTAYGQIASTPRGGDAALFLLTVDAVQPPGREEPDIGTGPVTGPVTEPDTAAGDTTAGTAAP